MSTRPPDQHEEDLELLAQLGELEDILDTMANTIREQSAAIRVQFRRVLERTRRPHHE